MKLPKNTESAVNCAQGTSLYTSPTNPVGWKGFQRDGI